VEAREIEELERLIREGAPESLSAPRTDQADAESSYAQAEQFDDLPISRYTKRALAEHKFVALTPVQKACLPHALCGRDVLGAAKTGSGKTLTFIIPVLHVISSKLPCDWSVLEAGPKFKRLRRSLKHCTARDGPSWTV
jgi:ATP-dependent RNA helicase DDX10/DBP4